MELKLLDWDGGTAESGLRGILAFYLAVLGLLGLGPRGAGTVLLPRCVLLWDL